MTDSLNRDLADVVAALAAADRVLIASHENPDGDAIGSMAAAAQALRGSASRCGCTSTRTRRSRTSTRSSTWTGSSARSSPTRLDGWTLLAARLRQRAAAGPGPRRAASALRAGDRHRPPPRQQPLWRRQPGRRRTPRPPPRSWPGLRRAGRPADPVIAEALYVGLVTDTGRFQYRTTSPAALRLAARAGRGRRRRPQGVRAGVRDGAVGQDAAARPRARARPVVRRRTAAGQLRHPRRPRAGGGRRGHDRGPDRPPAGGRGRAGGRPDPRAGAARERHVGPNRVSLRSRGRSTCPQIARKSSGGGHKQAAGFSHPGSVEQIRDFIVESRSTQPARPSPPRRSSMTAARDGSVPRRQARRADVVRRAAAAAARAGHASSAMPARSTPSPPACCWCWRAARRGWRAPVRAGQELPRRRPARRVVVDAGREGELYTDRRVNRSAALREAAASLTGVIEQRVPLASAVRVDGERSYARMRRGETARRRRGWCASTGSTSLGSTPAPAGVDRGRPARRAPTSARSPPTWASATGAGATASSCGG